ncbi:peroxiredoxin [Vulgatibacter sp.]|uniref:peroxiredoxin n=1 Tax=Vulgatibacter sp. TaxID=1971226 RepID=UPI00356611B4
MIQVLQKAPDFSATAVVGNGDFTKVSLSDYRGKWVVLFFYPLDFTFVCPTEIQEFSKRQEEFKNLNAVVLGASVDSEHSHKAWINNGLGQLNYPLISDFSKEISRKYGALLEDKGFSTRATFLIDPEGTIHYASYNSPNVGRSVAEVIRTLQAAQTGERCPAEWKPGMKTV